MQKVLVFSRFKSRSCYVLRSLNCSAYLAVWNCGHSFRQHLLFAHRPTQNCENFFRSLSFSLQCLLSQKKVTKSSEHPDEIHFCVSACRTFSSPFLLWGQGSSSTLSWLPIGGSYWERSCPDQFVVVASVSSGALRIVLWWTYLTLRIDILNVNCIVMGTPLEQSILYTRGIRAGTAIYKYNFITDVSFSNPYIFVEISILFASWDTWLILLVDDSWRDTV